MEVKFKKRHENAKIPSYTLQGDAGLDMTCVSVEDTGTHLKYNTGLSVEIPQGHVGLLFPRSSICKKSLSLSNSIGVIDETYRGNILAIFNKNNNDLPVYEIGERCCQLIIIPYPKIQPVEVDELQDSVRGENGIGSTGA